MRRVACAVLLLVASCGDAAQTQLLTTGVLDAEDGGVPSHGPGGEAGAGGAGASGSGAAGAPAAAPDAAVSGEGGAGATGGQAGASGGVGGGQGGAGGGQAGAGGGDPDGPGTLTLSFDTTPVGGAYAPRNIVAVWIEDAGGQFVRTIGRWAGRRRSHLVSWVVAAGSADVDAVAGATRRDHSQRLTLTWNVTDRSGQVVPAGIYRIRMELADGNSSIPAQNHQGTFGFEKGPASTQAVSGGGFDRVEIVYTPSP